MFSTNHDTFSGGQHVLPGRVPGRSLPYLRLGSHQVQQHEPGAAQRPYDRDLPSRHQMYIPQIRCFRHDPEARRSLHPRAEHPQREDLHLSLVLVHPTRGHVRSRAALQHGRRPAAQHSRDHPQEAFQVRYRCRSQRIDQKDSGDYLLLLTFFAKIVYLTLKGNSCKTQ